MKNFLMLFVAIISVSAAAMADLQPVPPSTQPSQPVLPPNNGPQPWPPGPGPGPQPGPPGWSDVFGPARTVRWWDLGSFQAEKFIDMNVNVDVQDQFVNEVFVAAQDNQVEVRDAVAYMSDGRAFQVRNLIGVIQEGRQYRVPLDYRNSLRLRRLVITIRASNPFGSRSRFYSQLGLAY